MFVATIVIIAVALEDEEEEEEAPATVWKEMKTIIRNTTKTASSKTLRYVKGNSYEAV